MSLFLYIVVHGSIFAIVFTLYLLAVMIGFSPRVWAMSDYPPEITEHVPPQTKKEKRKATLIYIPFMIIGIIVAIVGGSLLLVIVGSYCQLGSKRKSKKVNQQ